MNIYEKINSIMEAVESLQKDGKVAFGSTKYNYLSEAKTTAEMRKQLIKHKLVILPIGVQEEVRGQITQGKYTYKLVDAENPEEFIILESGGQGHDSADKGSGKASSYAYKYLMWRTFAIPSNDDPDQVSSDEIKAKADTQADMPEEERIDPNKKIEAVHITYIKNKLKSLGKDEEAFLTYMEIHSLEDMTIEQFTLKAKPALEKVKK